MTREKQLNFHFRICRATTYRAVYQVSISGVYNKETLIWVKKQNVKPWNIFATRITSIGAHHYGCWLSHFSENPRQHIGVSPFAKGF